MRAKDIRAMNMALTKVDLHYLNIEAADRNEEPILVEIAKAMTLALLHKEIEARVVCDTVADYAKAVLLFSTGRLGKDHGGKWAKDTLELPNGSAVVVILRVNSQRTLW
jgi:hypothetical protein